MYTVIPYDRTVLGIETPAFLVVHEPTNKQQAGPFLSRRDAELIAWAMNKEVN